MSDEALPAEGQPAELPTSDCTVCSHAQAADIDAGLLSGTPIRTVAETHGLSRSAVHRHRQNHLTLQTITDAASPEQAAKAEPLRIIDVHRQLAALADRLETVVDVAARTRKAVPAVGAARELRQTLTAIADIQSNPDLRRAASAEQVCALIDDHTSTTVAQIFDYVLRQFGAQYAGAYSGSGQGEVARIAYDLIAGCLDSLMSGEYRFEEVDTSAAQALVEREALARADRIEAEVQRRVEAELARRERQARPALEAAPVHALEGEVWSA